jgi:hypothetical protein
MRSVPFSSLLYSALVISSLLFSSFPYSSHPIPSHLFSSLLFTSLLFSHCCLQPLPFAAPAVSSRYCLHSLRLAVDDGWAAEVALNLGLYFGGLSLTYCCG